MAETNYEILGRKVKMLYPEIAEKLISKPVLSDIEKIPDIFCTCHFNQNTDHKTKLFFIAVILKLYDPDVLAGYKRNLSKGIRGRIAVLFGSSETAISNNIKTVRDYYSVLRWFYSDVNYIYQEISKVYSEDGAID